MRRIAAFCGLYWFGLGGVRLIGLDWALLD